MSRDTEKHLFKLFGSKLHTYTNTGHGKAGEIVGKQTFTFHICRAMQNFWLFLSDLLSLHAAALLKHRP